MPGTGPTMAVNMASLFSRAGGRDPGQDLQGWPQPERQGKKPGTGRVNHDQ
ncbi:hypothetical protein [Bacillus subtilis]|uniref:hypothetical protein n=1 Tax=Bacillus subtilis TaxID=1423 RepID=UPI0034E252A2